MTANAACLPDLLLNASGELDAGKLPGSGDSSILFAADFWVRPEHSIHQPDDLFSPEILQLVQQSTFAVVNFEGSIRPGGSEGIPKSGPHLAMHQCAPQILKSCGFHACTLANNHAMDYGAEALRDALRLCNDCDLQHVGAGMNQQEAMRPLTLSLPGETQVQILSMCEREFGITDGSRPGTAWLTSPEAEDAVAQAKRESHVVIVCAHGGNELMPLPSAQRRRQLQRLIEAGADLVIGHHPHVPQGWEPYGNGYIFYSLGDFYFDSRDGRRYDYCDWGYMVLAHLRDRRIRMLEILPYERVDNKVVRLGGRRDAATHLAYLEQLSHIVGGKDFDGYWQQLAMDRLPAYEPVLRSRLAAARITWRKRIKDTLNLGRAAVDLWLDTPTPVADGLSPALAREALGTLNSIRCDSHRWVIETALSVLSGESPDLRSPAVREQLKTMAPFYGYRR
jgi:hypothetical protein